MARHEPRKGGVVVAADDAAPSRGRASAPSLSATAGGETPSREGSSAPSRDDAAASRGRASAPSLAATAGGEAPSREGSSAPSCADAAPSRVRAASPSRDDAVPSRLRSKISSRAGVALPRVLAAAPRAGLSDVCERLWNAVGCGLGRTRRNGGAVVHPSSTQEHGGHGVVVGKSRQSDGNAAVAVAQGFGSDVVEQSRKSGSNAAVVVAQGAVVEPQSDGVVGVDPPRPRRTQMFWQRLEDAERRSRPAKPLKVSGEDVSDEELAQYANYCQDSLKRSKKVICHMYFFDDRNYGNRYYPSDFLWHCFDKHKKKGLECNESDCRVRVSTNHERVLHTHFCHELLSGWWERGEYRARLEKYYKCR